MGTNIYATVEFQSEEGTAEKLTKIVSEDYKAKTFGELLDKMTDGNSDFLNPEEYSGLDMQYASALERMLLEGNKDSGNIILKAYNIHTNDDEPVNLGQKISDFNDKIIGKEIKNIYGTEREYQTITLGVKSNTGGGIDD